VAEVALTTDRRAVEADLVRAHLPLTSRAVNELARRLPAHVHHDDLLSAAADDLLPRGDHGPDQLLVDRERRAYLTDAVLALLERLRAVVIGHFYEERPMLEIAAELGVTESRVSQLRAEALILLRDGLNAHLDPDTHPPAPRPDGRVAKRRAAYHAAIAACSDYRARLDAAPRPLLERAAERRPSRLAEPQPAATGSA
jgi:hypothetical protein